MKGVELFSGSGTVSRTFRSHGWEMEEVDILGGKDVMTWEPTEKYDFLWASPPCQDYSNFSGRARATKYGSIWEADRTLWLRTLDLVSKIRPRFWVLENVKMAQWLWGRAPYHYGGFFLWGYYPVPQTTISWRTSLKGTHLERDPSGNERQFSDGRTAAQRAEIPAALAEAICNSVTSTLMRERGTP